MLQRVAVRVGYHHRELVGNGHFLEQPEQDPPQAQHEAVGVRSALCIQLSEEVLRPLDGAADNLRKERRIQGYRDEVASRRQSPPIHIQQVTQQLEAVIGETQRRCQQQHGVGIAFHPRRVQLSCQEPCTLEAHQQDQQAGNGHGQVPQLSGFGRCLIEKPRGAVHTRRHREQESCVPDAPGRIKQERQRQQNGWPALHGRVVIDQQSRRQECCKDYREKRHSYAALLSISLRKSPTLARFLTSRVLSLILNSDSTAAI